MILVACDISPLLEILVFLLEVSLLVARVLLQCLLKVPPPPPPPPRAADDDATAVG